MIEVASGEEQLLLLAEVDILKGLPQSEVEYFANLSPILQLSKKESLILGEYQPGILLLMKGRVRAYESTSRGQDLTFSVVEGGTVVGQTSATSRPSQALRIEALEPSLLSAVGWEDFEDLVLRYPTVGLKTIRLLGKQLGVYEDRISDLIRKEVPARLAGLILRLSEREDAVPRAGERKISARYTHQQLASMVGSNREAVTRALGVLKKAGAVEIWNRQIYVTDLDSLVYFAGEVR